MKSTEPIIAQYSDAAKVQLVIRASDDVEQRRGENRTLINEAANNEPLMTDEVADQQGILVNTRWGEMMELLANARRQMTVHFNSMPTFFTVSLPKAPEEVRADWEGEITEFINNKMKQGDRGLEWFATNKSRWSAVVCHGIGPLFWDDPKSWNAKVIAICDLRIPTDTLSDFSNLTCFAVRKAYTPGELSAKAYSKTQGRFKWNKKAVASMLDQIEQCKTVMAQNQYDYQSTPEKFEELRKQNGGYWASDAMPVINLWHFYFKNDEGKNGKWELKVVPDMGSSVVSPEVDDNEFICESIGPVADKWQHILQVQYGDLNNTSPHKYQSVRSLGFALYEPCYWTDITRCRLIQHVQDNFNIYLRMADPVDRARASVQVFQNMAVLKPGVTVVPNTERHQVDGNLVEAALAMTKQLEGEMSSTYTQEVDSGTKKEQTAFETGVKVQQRNAMLSGILMEATFRETFVYKEICRRFCLENSDDEDVQDFRTDMLKRVKIPKAWLDVKYWVIEPTTPLGNGNPTMAMVESENVMKLRPLAGPAAQQEMVHDAAVTMVGPRRAKRWFSVKEKPTSEASVAAMNAFSALMQGGRPQVPNGLSMLAVVQTLVQYCVDKITTIERTTKMATPQEMIGLTNAVGYVKSLLQGMEGDQANMVKIKEFAHAIAQVENELKRMQHKQQAEQQKAQQQDKMKEANGEAQAHLVETAAKIKGKTAETANKIQMKKVEGQQKLQHQNQAFVADQQRKNLSTVAEIARNGEREKAKKPTDEK